MTFLSDLQQERPSPQAFTASAANWPEPRPPEEVLSMLAQGDPPNEEYSVDAF